MISLLIRWVSAVSVTLLSRIRHLTSECASAVVILYYVRGAFHVVKSPERSPTHKNGFCYLQVDFEGSHPIEGAKEVSTVITRYVSRALRLWLHQQREISPQQLQLATAAWKERLLGAISKVPRASQLLEGTGLRFERDPKIMQELRLIIDTTKRTLRVMTTD